MWALLSADGHVTSHRAIKRWKARQHALTCDTEPTTQRAL